MTSEEFAAEKSRIRYGRYLAVFEPQYQVLCNDPESGSKPYMQRPYGRILYGRPLARKHYQPRYSIE